MRYKQHTIEKAPEDSLLAAIDLGSNSFHMVIAKLSQGELTTVDIMSEKVQLAAGIDANKELSVEAIERGIDTLSRFAQCLRDLPRSAVKVVGTNALREAANRRQFTDLAEKVLNVPIEVIAGREEARLIYLGVSHTLADTPGARLVIDIGGGSTECIIGDRFEAIELESLHMGCVSYTKDYFPDGKLNQQNFRRAEYAALRELLAIKERYIELGWTSCVGSSGTVKAIKNACMASGFCEERLTKEALIQLKDKILSFDKIEDLDIPELKPERVGILPAGLAILCAIFDSLGIEEMDFSEGALREGLLYDMAGRLYHEDVRERSISALSQRYHVDQNQANRVEQAAIFSLAQVKDSWNLNDPVYHEMLSWAARAHEIGLTIAHSQFHKHSAYLLLHSDLAGFTNTDQLLLSFLARGHRRKFPKEEYKALPDSQKESYKRLCILLRLAAIMNRSRSNQRLPAFTIKADDNQLDITFPEGWLSRNPLTQADLELEIDYLKNADIKLTIQ